MSDLERFTMINDRLGLLESKSASGVDLMMERVNTLSDALAQVERKLNDRVLALEKKFSALESLRTMGVSGPTFESAIANALPRSGSSTGKATIMSLSHVTMFNDLIAQRDAAWAKLTDIKNKLADYTQVGYIRAQYIRDIIDGVKDAG